MNATIARKAAYRSAGGLLLLAIAAHAALPASVSGATERPVPELIADFATATLFATLLWEGGARLISARARTKKRRT